MNPLHTLERPAHPVAIAPVLNRNGFTCTLLTLAAGVEAALPDSHSLDAQLLFVVEGGITVSSEGLTTVVDTGQAMLLPPGGGAAAVCAYGGALARVLRVEIPPRQVITPQLITPGA